VGKGQRTRYSPAVKEEVRKRYKFCRTTADKQALADELNIGSVPKLYNLASRLGAAGQAEDPNDRSNESFSAERLYERESPATTKFSRDCDRYLKDEFGRRHIEDIAYHLEHSEAAMLYRARHLGLRLPVKYWQIEKVARWFGMQIDEFRDLAQEGIDIYPLANRSGRVKVEVVSTTSLGRWLKVKKNVKRLWAEEPHPDEFFLLEIEESINDLVNNKTTFERCKFLSHGHVCMNPFTDNSFGLFCTNNEKYRAGEDPRCAVRTLAIEDLAPEE